MNNKLLINYRQTKEIKKYSNNKFLLTKELNRNGTNVVVILLIGTQLRCDKTFWFSKLTTTVNYMLNLKITY